MPHRNVRVGWCWRIPKLPEDIHAMSHHGSLITTTTARGRIRYEVEIRHHGLNKFQIVLGDDPYVVEQKAAARMAQ